MTFAPMTEYWITAVHYEQNGPIAEVHAMVSQDSFLGQTLRVQRDAVAYMIRSGVAVFFTAFAVPGIPGRWNKGANVVLMPDNQFITTEADGRMHNNLAHLPRY